MKTKEIEHLKKKFKEEKKKLIHVISSFNKLLKMLDIDTGVASRKFEKLKIKK